MGFNPGPPYPSNCCSNHLSYNCQNVAESCISRFTYQECGKLLPNCKYHSTGNTLISKDCSLASLRYTPILRVPLVQNTRRFDRSHKAADLSFIIVHLFCVFAQ